MSRDYIPGGNSDFYGFQQFLTDQVTLNLATWGIPASTGAELTSRNAAYNTLYAAIANKQVRTPQQVEAHTQGKRAYTDFLRQLVQGYLVNNPGIPFDEKRAMGLNPRQGRGSRPKMEVIPVVTLRPLGGGRVRFEVRMPGTSGRARMHPESNGVELRARFSQRGGERQRPSETTEPMPIPVPVPVPIPVPTPDPVATREVHTVLRTRAVFTEDTDMQGHTMRVEARYVNTSDPAKNGPWSNEVTVVVS